MAVVVSVIAAVPFAAAAASASLRVVTMCAMTRWNQPHTHAVSINSDCAREPTRRGGGEVATQHARGRFASATHLRMQQSWRLRQEALVHHGEAHLPELGRQRRLPTAVAACAAAQGTPQGIHGGVGAGAGGLRRRNHTARAAAGAVQHCRAEAAGCRGGSTMLNGALTFEAQHDGAHGGWVS